ncbi:hypothetical protein [Cohnella sp.]|uniref:hypothetical protein n=1 Tax=Cohnella sp. TaxID=1883426 RepID=UPI003567C193
MKSINSVFRKHPELEATGKLSILGESRCTAEVMDAYMRRRNPKIPKVAELYLRLGQRYEIRGDVAYCQMVYETRSWTAQVTGPYWAPMTLEQWATESSVEVLMQILYAFATELPVPQALDQTRKQTVILDQAGWRGKASCWQDLNGKWTRSGHHYGQDIVAIWRSMLEWKGSGEVIPMEEGGVMGNSQEGERLRSNAAKERITGSLDWTSFCTEEMSWLKDKGLLPSPVPHPERKVSWAELANLLRRWEDRPSTAAIDGNGVSLKKEE